MKKPKTVTGFDEMKIIRTLERLERATAIDIKPTKILMHPDFFRVWVQDKHPEFFPANNELKFGSYLIKITTHVRTWGLIVEPYGL